MWIDENANGTFNMKYEATGLAVGAAVNADPTVNQVAAQSGSWTYDRDTLTDIGKEWRTLEEECKRTTGEILGFDAVNPPGNEYVSKEVAHKINKSNRDYIRMLGEMSEYSEAQAVACEKALGTYEESEGERRSFFEGLFASIENDQRESGGLL